MGKKLRANTRKHLHATARRKAAEEKADRPDVDSGFMYRHTGEMRRALRGVDTERWRYE